MLEHTYLCRYLLYSAGALCRFRVAHNEMDRICGHFFVRSTPHAASMPARLSHDDGTGHARQERWSPFEMALRAYIMMYPVG